MVVFISVVISLLIVSCLVVIRSDDNRKVLEGSTNRRSIDNLDEEVRSRINRGGRPDRFDPDADFRHDREINRGDRPDRFDPDADFRHDREINRGGRPDRFDPDADFRHDREINRGDRPDRFDPDADFRHDREINRGGRPDRFDPDADFRHDREKMKASIEERMKRHHRFHGEDLDIEDHMDKYRMHERYREHHDRPRDIGTMRYSILEKKLTQNADKFTDEEIQSIRQEMDAYLKKENSIPDFHESLKVDRDMLRKIDDKDKRMKKLEEVKEKHKNMRDEHKEQRLAARDLFEAVRQRIDAKLSVELR